MKLPQVVMPPKPVAPPPPAAEQTDAPAKKKGGSLGTIFALLVLVGILGGLVWAVTAGPFKDQFTALTEEPKAPDTTPKKVDLEPTPDGEKPAWLVEKEKQKAEQEAERKRMAEIEAAATDPERQRMLAELEAELKQLDYLEAEQRSLKLAAQAGAVAGVANGKKIEDLQKQIDDLKTMVAEKQNKKAARKVDPVNPDGEVEIVKDLKGARNADIGYLSLRTVNPSSANVLMNGDELGSTPLSKVPVEAGVHRLRLIDGDGRPRMLSVIIEAGKTNEMRAVDVSSLPLIP